MQEKTWVLMTNVVRALILRGLEDGASEDPIELVSKAKSTHLREIFSDKAGRSFASDASGRRSAMEPGSDPVLCDMHDFAHEILATLDGHLRAGRLTRLAIFAAPKIFGILRQEMPASLGKIVILERGLNLMNLSGAELHDAVIGALRVECQS
ncbi:host attachment protein [Meridianimarinicoccus sp. RP-17]|uniref:host attachment protein n=1 Tax=Meridianimarinicoccus zhengii TaxID=2056810 RepID=UPI000DAE8434|nr:host attachment protein [Phycocomes zhengii]